jgi:hypothetical protein
LSALIEEIGRRLGFVPTWVVSTGGGFHVYWTFREPLIVDSDAERERFAAVALALTRFAQDVATAVGIATSGHAWEVDSTHDLARVLRVVGTLNCKREPYRSVTFHVERQVRYDITEFESNPALAPFVVDSAAASTRRTRRSSPSPCPRPDAVLLATVSQRIEEMQLGDAGFEAVWSHDESLLWKPTAGQPGRAPDTSMSGWDYRLARWAPGWDASQETTAIMATLATTIDRPPRLMLPPPVGDAGGAGAPAGRRAPGPDRRCRCAGPARPTGHAACP